MLNVIDAQYRRSANAVSELDSVFKVRPCPRRLDLAEIRNSDALYTVSIGSRSQSPVLLASGLAWTIDAFDRVTLLLGDGLYQITLRITEGLSTDAAAVAAQLSGDIALRTLQSKFGGLVDVIRTSDVFKSESFASSLEEVKKLSRDCPQFLASCSKDALSFVTRQHRRGHLRLAPNEAHCLATEYVEREIAVYLSLAREGKLVEVYLGRELPTLKKIIENKIQGAPNALTRRVNVSLEHRRT